MTVHVKLFAAARELAGQPELAVDVGDGARLADVQQAVVAKVPGIETLLSHARWAVDSEFAAANTVVTETSEIAMIPPVSGG